MTYLLALLTLLLGLGILVSTLRKRPRPPVGNLAAGVLGGLLVIALSAGIGLIGLGNSDMAKEEPENERARAGTAAATPEPEASTPTPQPEITTPEPDPEPEVGESTPEPEPVVEESVEASSSDLTPAQTLAVIADRDRDDTEIAALYDRLDAACPENGSQVADMVVNLQGLIRKDTGQEMPIPEVMTQFINAQEGPAAENGMSCVETGAALSALIAGGL